MNSLGNRICELREKSGLTQEQLAEMVGVNRVTLARYESDSYVPGSKKLSAIANALHVSANILLGNGDEMSDEDREIWELRESVRNDPERRYLFSMARDADIKQIRQAIAITVPYRCSPTPPPKI